MRRPPHTSILAVLLLALAIAALYGQSIGFERTYDDFAVVQPDEIENGTIDWSPGQRGLRQLSYRLDHALFSDDFGPYHAQNLVWHLLASCLVAAVAVRLGVPPRAAFAGALLFAVHPVHVESVANLANRKEPMATALVLLAFLAYLRSRPFVGGRALAMSCLSAILFVAATYAKETAAILPLVIAAYELPRRDGTRRQRVTVAAVALLTTVAIIGYVANAWSASGARLATLGGYEGALSPASVVLAAGRAFWAHLRMAVLPFGLSPDHRLALESPVAVADVVGWITAIGLVAAAWWFTRNRPIPRFAVLWALLFYLPTSSVVPVSYLVAERYLYLPSVGLAWLVGYGLDRSGVFDSSAPESRRLAFGLAGAAVFLAASIETATYAAKWRSSTKLWTYVAATDPDSALARFELGVDAILRGEPTSALESLDRAIELRPRWARAHFNRSQARAALGDRTGAMADLDRAIELRPDYWPAFSNRGRMHWEDGDPSAALADFDRAIRIHSGAAELYFNRGAVRALSGDPDRARADFRKALEIDPDHAAARRNLEALGN